MLYVSLFAGAGGGDIAHQRIGGHTCIGYVEWDDYAQRVLAARMRDGHLDTAPVWGDVRAFACDAALYRGVADLVTAGFPCQPFSCAGQGRASDDDRNMWPATLDVLRAVRPAHVHLENVPGLLAGSHGYFGTILGDLAEIGYDAEWGVLSAADVGARHLRSRLWIVAHADGGVGRAELR